MNERSWVFRKLSEKVKGSGAALLHKIRANVNFEKCTRNVELLIFQAAKTRKVTIF